MDPKYTIQIETPGGQWAEFSSWCSITEELALVILRKTAESYPANSFQLVEWEPRVLASVRKVE